MLKIGLFGTCGKSKWRYPFIVKYTNLNIPYFNPQSLPSIPERSKIEAQQLNENDIIIIAITNEEYSIASLSEVGIALNKTVQNNEKNRILVYIDSEIMPELNNKEMKSASLRARKILAQHLRFTPVNVIVVDNLDELLRNSIFIYRTELIMRSLDEMLESMTPKARFKRWWKKRFAMSQSL